MITNILLTVQLIHLHLNQRNTMPNIYLCNFICKLQVVHLAWNIRCVVRTSVVMSLELLEIVKIQLVRVDVSVVMDLY